MGYTTEFSGSFTPNRPFTEEETNFLNRFSSTRRMKRNVFKIIELEPDFKNGFNGSYGDEGEYYIGGESWGYENHIEGNASRVSIISYNENPKNQAGFWCRWIIEDGEIVWDGGEKFYNYVEWLQYIIDNFLSVWGIVINGEVTYEGEDLDDFGKIIVVDNVITVNEGILN